MPNGRTYYSSYIKHVRSIALQIYVNELICKCCNRLCLVSDAWSAASSISGYKKVSLLLCSEVMQNSDTIHYFIYLFSSNHIRILKMIILIAVLLIASLVDSQKLSPSQFCFQSSYGGIFQWASNCDFRTSDMGTHSANLVDCVHLCLADAECTHFAVGGPVSRSCRLKSISRISQLNNFVSFQDGFWAGDDGPSSESYCGFIPTRTYDQGFPSCSISTPPPAPTHDYINTTTCHGDTLSISCPPFSPQQTIIIVGANYGRYSKTVCPGPNQQNQNTNCNKDVTDIVGNLCNAKPVCSFQSSDVLFTDPCFGTYKYLTVQYYCSLLVE